MSTTAPPVEVSAEGAAGLSQPTSLEREPAARNAGTRLPWVAVAFVTWAVGMVTLYREPLTSGFDRLFGDVGDQRLLVYLSEHWLLVFKGHSPWRNPGFFFPLKGVLGFGDTILLYQPLYAPLRLLGFDPFVAYQLTLMGLTTIGFVSAIWFLHRFARVRFPIALAGGFLFAFSNAIGVKAGHGQLYAVNLVPLVGVLLATCATSVRTRPTRAALTGGAAGLLVALLLFTSFYIGWFLVLSGGVAVVFLLLTGALKELRPWWQGLRSRPQATATTAIALGAGFLIGIIPFLSTYLPTLDYSGGRTYDEAMLFAPVPSDALNVGADNLVWGDVLSHVGIDAAQLRNGERSLAVTPLLAVSTVIGAAVLVACRRRWASVTRSRVVVALTLTGMVLTILPMKANGHSLWAVVWAAIPGSHAIRAADRLELLTNGVFVVAWALIADTVLGRALRRPRRQACLGAAAVSAWALLLGLEQVQVHHYSTLRRHAELAWLDEVPPAPAGCRGFYVTGADPARPSYAVQIDAMLISSATGIPTINGYDGLFPKGWSLLDASSAQYRSAVEAWLAANGLDPSDICAYNLGDRTWSMPGPS